MNLFKLKFQVRVKHHHGLYFKVQYRNFYVCSRWSDISYYDSPDKTLYPEVHNIIVAENIAKNLTPAIVASIMNKNVATMLWDRIGRKAAEKKKEKEAEKLLPYKVKRIQ